MSGAARVSHAVRGSSISTCASVTRGKELAGGALSRAYLAAPAVMSSPGSIKCRRPCSLRQTVASALCPSSPPSSASSSFTVCLFISSNSDERSDFRSRSRPTYTPRCIRSNRSLLAAGAGAVPEIGPSSSETPQSESTTPAAGFFGGAPLTEISGTLRAHSWHTYHRSYAVRARARNLRHASAHYHRSDDPLSHPCRSYGA